MKPFSECADGGLEPDDELVVVSRHALGWKLAIEPECGELAEMRSSGFPGERCEIIGELVA